ncbi:hypothetical protein Droror1_Dr00001923 [Drosera rotundifolia]
MCRQWEAEVEASNDVCFMDIQIPEMDGFEVTRRIRLMESSTYNNDGLAASGVGSSLMSKRHMPILAMTAGVIHSTYEDQKRIDPGHFECHWVIFTFDDGLAKYNLNLDTTNTGALVPAKNVQYLERKWCILKPSAKLDYTLVGDSVSYACGLDLLTASASGTEHLARIWMRLAMHPMPSTVTSKLTTRTLLPPSSRTLE